jgi:hypothetical protein
VYVEIESLVECPTRDDLAKYAQYCSMLEDAVARAYCRMALLIAEKELKPLLLHIAYDSFKHSRLLKEMARGLSAKVKADLEACLKQMGEAWKRTVKSAEDMAFRKERIRTEELLTIIDRMEEIEGFAGEEYLMFINSRILQVVSLINERNLELYKTALELIAEDGERHRSILSKIKEYLIK